MTIFPIELENYHPLEVLLPTDESFLKIRETLTRIGIASLRYKELYQSCHILHKRGIYYICSFKELFALDGRKTNINWNDIQRRNMIAHLLEDWGLLTIVSPELHEDVAAISSIKIIPFHEKHDWELIEKYSIGKRK